MKTPDEVERLMKLAGKDRTMREMYIAALWRAELWFPIEYHPELGNPYEPSPGEKIPFWIGQDEQGAFVPLFSSPKLMRLEMQRFPRRHTRARMATRDLFPILMKVGLEVRINPGAEVSGRLAVEVLEDLVKHDGPPPEEPTTVAHGSMKPLGLEAWPEAWRERLRTEAEEQPGLIALWLCTASEVDVPVPEGALYAVAWVRDVERTPLDGVQRAARLAFPERHVEWVLLDEGQSAESLAGLRAYPPIFPSTLLR